jgi:sec-independent protein translocase protein TatB
MFDVGFSELLVIAVVALLVLGPERLPKAARFAGLWVRKARDQWNSVKAEFERDLADEDLKRSLRETQDALRDAQASLRNAGAGLQQELQGAGDAVMRGMPAAAATDAASTDPAALEAPLESTRHLSASAQGQAEAVAPVAQPASADEEQSMHTPMDEPPPPADADDEIPQR